MLRFVAYYASRDLVPYSVYSLLFADNGVSTGQISTPFIIWSLTSFVFEVSSDTWVDTIDRRLLLVLSAIIYAVGFSTWIVVPTYAGFATGFVLWGLSGAIMSGTFESLLYDELVERGAEAARHPPTDLSVWRTPRRVHSSLTSRSIGRRSRR